MVVLLTYASLYYQEPRVVVPPRLPTVSVAFLQAYFSAVDPSLLPGDPGDLHLLLDTQLFQRAVYELRHELAHRSDWGAHLALESPRSARRGSMRRNSTEPVIRTE